MTRSVLTAVVLVLGVSTPLLSQAAEAPLSPLGYSVKEAASVYIDSNELERQLLIHYLRGVVNATALRVGEELEEANASLDEIEECLENITSWDWGRMITSAVVDGLEDSTLFVSEAIYQGAAGGCTTTDIVDEVGRNRK